MSVLRHLVLCLLSVSLLLAGCTGDTGSKDRRPTKKVTVTVLYKGSPVEGATVTFISQEAGAPPAFGKTDKDGKAKMKTYVEGDGAVLGQHKVLIDKSETVGGAPAVDQSSPNYVPPENVPPPKVKYLIPQKYSIPGTSGLTVEVKNGPNEITFDLKD
jgi:hypothetical protein